MTATVAKIGDAAAAFGYYSDKDDYYLSDKSAAEWYGAGAERLGLRGDVKPEVFRDVLAGKAGKQQVGKEGFREVRLPDGSARKVPQHTPGWDVTFSAPKSVSIAALVNKDERVTAAFDASVRAAMDHAERIAAVTRQRTKGGDYEWRHTGNLVAAAVRHSSSRNLDPQLHVHAVIANMTYDAATGKFASLDSRALFGARQEIENFQTNDLAHRLRNLGYDIEWRVRENGSATFEVAGIDEAERDLFSSRRKEIAAQLVAKGIDPATASREARQAATLDTRSPKEHVSGAELHARWAGQARATGFATDVRPHPEGPQDPPTEAERQAAVHEAAQGAVGQAVAQLGERQTRFTERQLVAAATTFSQGRASHADLVAAVREAHAHGDLLDRETQVRGYGKDLELVPGFTTREAVETEAAMLRRAQSLAERQAKLSLSGEAIDEQIAQQELAIRHDFTPEQRKATHAILEGRGSFHILQGYAGTAKTTSVLATTARAAHDAGLRVRAIAPTHSAAETLARAIGAEKSDVQTVASVNTRGIVGDGRDETWIVDEAGMVSAKDMQRLLERADRAGAQVILSGDTNQIGSIGAGAAFAQLQTAYPDLTSNLTDIKRQQVAETRQAIYDALHGDFKASLGKVNTREIGNREAAVAGLVDEYIQALESEKEALVVTLSRDDREAINTAVQEHREAGGAVTRVRTVTTLQAHQWTEAEKDDAARYATGMVLEATRDFVNGPKRGELATVTGVQGDKVTAVMADGHEWIIDPRRTTSFRVYDQGKARVGIGDRVVAKGAIYGRDPEDQARRVSVKSGTAMIVEGINAIDVMIARLPDNRRVAIDTRQGAKLDLAYAETANQAQGRTVDTVIAYMRSTQINLADRQHAYVSMSRARDKVVVVTDSRAKLAETLERSAHGKEAAADPRAPDPQPERAQDRSNALTPDERRADRAAARAGRRLERGFRHQERRHDRALKRDYRADRRALAKTHAIARKADRKERELVRKSGVRMEASLLERTFEGSAKRHARHEITRLHKERARAGRKLDADWTRHHARAELRQAERGVPGSALEARIRHEYAERRAKKADKRDRKLLRTGLDAQDRVRAKAAEIERAIVRQSGVRMDADRFLRSFENKRQKAARDAIKRVRAARAKRVAGIDAAMNRALDRSVQREASASGVSNHEALRRVVERTAIDRYIPLGTLVAGKVVEYLREHPAQRGPDSVARAKASAGRAEREVRETLGKGQKAVQHQPEHHQEQRTERRLEQQTGWQATRQSEHRQARETEHHQERQPGREPARAAEREPTRERGPEMSRG